MGRNYRGGRGGGRGYRGRNNNGGRGNSSSSNSNKKKTINDCWYYIGNVNQVTNFETTNDIVLNYILSKYDRSKDIYEDLRLLQETDVDSWKPKLASATSTDPDEKKRQEKENELSFNKATDEWYKRKATFESNKSKAYGLIWSKCAEALQNKIEVRSDFETNIRHNPVNLLKAVREHSMKYEEKKYSMEVIINSIRDWILCKQGKDDSLIAYTRNLKTHREQMESHIGSPIILTKLVRNDPNYNTVDHTKNESLIKNYDDKLNAYLHLRNSDQRKYGSLMQRYKQDYALKNPRFPNNMTESSEALSTHPFDNAEQLKAEKKNNNKDNKDKEKNDDTEEEQVPNLGFAQFNMIFAQLEGKCYCCGKYGHRSPDCHHKDSKPKDQWYINKTKEGVVQMAQVSDDKSATTPSSSITSGAASSANENHIGWAGVHCRFAQNYKNKEEFKKNFKHWILLDSDSNTTVICNPKYVTKIWDVNETMGLDTNGSGHLESKKKCHFPLLGEQWYNEDSMTNIISLADMADEYRVTMDTSKEKAFFVHMEDRVIRFVQMTNRLYAMDPREPHNYIIKRSEWSGEPFNPNYKKEKKQQQLLMHLQFLQVPNKRNNEYIQFMDVLEENTKYLSSRQLNKAIAARRAFHYFNNK